MRGRKKYYDNCHQAQACMYNINETNNKKTKRVRTELPFFFTKEMSLVAARSSPSYSIRVLYDQDLLNPLRTAAVFVCGSEKKARKIPVSTYFFVVTSFVLLSLPSSCCFGSPFSPI